MKKLLRKLHRWLGLLMAIQILAWMGSGFYFAWVPIETIRGEHLAADEPVLEPGMLKELVAPGDAVSVVMASLESDVESIEVALRPGEEEVYYLVVASTDDGAHRRLVSARTGEIQPRLTSSRAAELASQSIKGAPVPENVTLIESSEPGSEIRGRDLPLWRVQFTQPEGLVLYLRPWTGEVVARRTDRWRIFDFLWMLHIMDFDERDDFNTPLLQIAALLGFFIAASGVIYWAMTTRLFRRRRQIA